MNDASNLIMKRISKLLESSFNCLKVNLNFCGHFILPAAEDDVVELKHFQTRNILFLSSTPIEDNLKILIQEILKQV
jgi:hypothetical protein